MVMVPNWAGLPIGEALTFEHKRTDVHVGASIIQLLKPNPNRIGIIISCNESGGAVVGNDPTISTTKGIKINSYNTNCMITDAHFPGLAAQPWYGYPVGSTPWLSMTEIILVPVANG